MTMVRALKPLLLLLTSTPKSVKSFVTPRSIRRRTAIIRESLNITCGEGMRSKIHTTAFLVKDFEKKNREKILSKAGLGPAIISAETMVAMK